MAEERLREVLAFVNHKGGVGKTTTVQNLATGLRKYGAGHFGKDAKGRDRKPRVLVIDLDPQSCISYLFGWIEVQTQDEPTMYDAMSKQSQIPVYQVDEGLYLAPSSAKLIGIDPFLNQMSMPRKALTKLFAKSFIEMEGTELRDEGVTNIIEAFDYVLIDCPPAMSLLTYNALTAASGVIIPVQLEALAVKGIAEIINAIRETREDWNPELAIRGILQVMSQDQLNVTKEFKAFLGDKYEDYLFKSYIRHDAKIKESQGVDTDIFQYAPYCRAGMDYERFTKEILATANS